MTRTKRATLSQTERKHLLVEVPVCVTLTKGRTISAIHVSWISNWTLLLDIAKPGIHDIQLIAYFEFINWEWHFQLIGLFNLYWPYIIPADKSEWSKRMHRFKCCADSHRHVLACKWCNSFEEYKQQHNQNGLWCSVNIQYNMFLWHKNSQIYLLLLKSKTVQL